MVLLRLLPALLLFVGLCGIVSAGQIVVTINAVPPEPTTADLIQVRMTLEGCANRYLGDFVLDGSTVTVRTDQEDFCDPDAVIPEQFLDIGYLAAGTYQFRYLVCVNAPPPEDPCGLFSEETVIVRGVVPAPQAIPTLSLWTTLGLAATLMILGLSATARSR